MSRLTNMTRRKKKFSKYVVSTVILLNILFTAAVLTLCAYNKSIPDSLIIAWFAFTGTELVAMAGIKINENKKEPQ